MTETEAITALDVIEADAIKFADGEKAHGDADDVLLRFLHDNHPDVEAGWQRVMLRCKGFWYA